MRGVEIKNLRWRDVDFLRQSLTIRRSKTDAGLRSIPMNEDAYSAILELRERANGFNGTAPQHFLFPACEHGHIDPNRPMKSWRTAWRRMTQLIQCPVCRTCQGPGETCRNADCGSPIDEVKSPLAGLPPGTNILGVRREKPMLEMTPPTWQVIAMDFKFSVVYPP